MNRAIVFISFIKINVVKVTLNKRRCVVPECSSPRYVEQ